LIALALGVGACKPREVVVEKPVTRVVTQPVTRVATVKVTVEKAVVVTKRETVQVVVTLTPTPIPKGGTLVRTAFADAKTANPLLAADDASRAFCDLMFEGLLRVDPFTGELVPNLAESWTVSDDGLTYTFVLRQGIDWSDGYPITAQDVAFTYEALRSGRLDTPNAKEVADIVQIEILDLRTVAMTFAQADCGNLERLRFGLIPMHVFTDDMASFDWDLLAVHEFNSTPSVSNGPFRFGEWVRGDHWTVVRNERYWRGAPHLDAVVTRVVGGQREMVQLLQEGAVDIGESIRPEHISALEQVPELQIWKFLSDEYDFLGFQLGDPADPQPRLDDEGMPNEKHGAHPILGDVRVRRAIALALDREGLIAAARFGQGVPLNANSSATSSGPARSWTRPVGRWTRPVAFDKRRGARSSCACTPTPATPCARRWQPRSRTSSQRSGSRSR